MMSTKQLTQKAKQLGFTLIELSIVLVIIGLIVGGVLVGQDLIKAAEVRATVSQVEKFNTAVNTFRTKYNGIPGDMVNPVNFFPNIVGAGGADGFADGDGMVESAQGTSTKCTANNCIGGEAALFWNELSQANLIPDSITATDATAVTYTVNDSLIPQTKIGKGSRFAVNSVNGLNYFVIANFGSAALVAGTKAWTVGLSGLEAFAIDSKMDDSIPSTGQVVSIAVATGIPATPANSAASTAAAAGICYLTGGSSDIYNVGSTYGASPDCNISLRANF